MALTIKSFKNGKVLEKIINASKASSIEMPAAGNKERTKYFFYD